MMKRISAALEPVDVLMKDFSAVAADALKSRKTKSQIRRFTLQKLQKTLREVERSIQVSQAQDETQWSVEKNIVWPFENAAQAESSSHLTTLTTRGRHLEDGSLDLTILLSDSMNAPREILHAKGSKITGIQARFSASALTDVVDPPIRTDGCTLTIDTADGSHMECEALSFTMEDVKVRVNRLMAHRAKEGALGFMDADVIENERPVGTLQIEWVNDSKPVSTWSKIRTR